jgi:hypothetical protein
LRTRPLIERKQRLEIILRRVPAGIRYCEHDDSDGEALFRAACRMGLEGIVSKRAQSRYRSGRSKSWIKSKNPKAPSVIRASDGPLKLPARPRVCWSARRRVVLSPLRVPVFAADRSTHYGSCRRMLNAIMFVLTSLFIIATPTVSPAQEHIEYPWCAHYGRDSELVLPIQCPANHGRPLQKPTTYESQKR